MQDILPPKKPLPPPAPLPPAALATGPAPRKLLQSRFSKARRNRRLVWAATVTVVLLGLAGAAAGFIWWYNSLLTPLSATSRRITVTIASGTAPDAIAGQLQHSGVIRSAEAFYWYAKLHGDLGKLQAGTYLFSPTQSVPDILSQIVAGKVDTYNVTILPGETLADIKRMLVRDGFAAADIDAAFAQSYSSPLLQDKPDGVNLEGYIFPDTYEITSETTVPQLLEKAFATFYSRLQAENLPGALAAKGFNLHQAITLASIIEQEASDAADRRQIAQVFEKRLSIGMPLGSDVTFIYAAKQLGVAPTPELQSPYNTRINTGLPPGAISNFTMDAIEAVADPAQGDYLYFVAGDDGTVHYATTEAGHEANVAKYCTQTCH